MTNQGIKIGESEFQPSEIDWQSARDLALRYTFLIKPGVERGYIGTVAELPGVVADGNTSDECSRHLRSLLQYVLATYLHDGETPPPPGV